MSRPATLGPQNKARQGAEPRRVHPNGNPYVSQFSFSGTDGANPTGGVVQLTNGGALYGTTTYGGSSGNGTVFAFPPGATSDTVLHSFNPGNPVGGLTYANGFFNAAFYGTASTGGKYGYGYVFQISPSGSKSDFYDFKGPGVGDGANPQANLIYVAPSYICGTTYNGGVSNAGTVFCVNGGGHESVLHSFSDSKADGGFPVAPVTAVGDTLYGTTSAGGAHSSGTVFSVQFYGGPYTVLYSFGAGAKPSGGLTYVNGAFYGVSATGGPFEDFFGNDGFVYKISTSGNESHLYDFQYCDPEARGCGAANDPTDGEGPWGSLLYANGQLYGETQYGGFYDGGYGGGGTLFSVTLSGNENVLWNFGNGTDGAVPQGGLIYVAVYERGFFQTVLWGTTSGGGTSGDGTIFSYCITACI